MHRPNAGLPRKAELGRLSFDAYTRSAGSLVRAEMNRNKRSPQCGAAPIEIPDRRLMTKYLLRYAAGIFGIRRRPTLPDRYQSSTIGTEGLNFCVRYGNRCDPFVIATGNGELFLHAP